MDYQTVKGRKMMTDWIGVARESTPYLFILPFPSSTSHYVHIVHYVQSEETRTEIFKISIKNWI